MKNIPTLQKNYAISKRNISTVFDTGKISLTFTSTRDNDELTKYSDSFFFFFSLVKRILKTIDHII